MAITVLGANDSGSTSRTVINDNFTDLDTTKADLASPTFTGTPTLPTGTVAVTQSASDNSTKVATTAYVDALALAGTALTLIPSPAASLDGGGVIAGPGGSPITDATIGYVGQIVIPFKITVNKVSVRTTNVTTPGPLDITLYSESGQTQLFSVTSANLTANVINTVAVSAVVVNPGIYYIMINANGSFSAQTYMYRQNTAPFSTTEGLIGNVSSEPVLRGTLAIASGTPPATITPTSIVDTADCTVVCRLDN